MISLTLEELQKVKEALTVDKIGRKPIFRFHPLVDQIYHGIIIDELFTSLDPIFDKKIHKGFLLPMKHKEIIRSTFSTILE